MDAPGAHALSSRDDALEALELFQRQNGRLPKRNSLPAMKAENKNIQWEHSYVAGDKTFCIYIADNEDLIAEHAERSGFPASTVSLVISIGSVTSRA